MNCYFDSEGVGAEDFIIEILFFIYSVGGLFSKVPTSAQVYPNPNHPGPSRIPLFLPLPAPSSFFFFFSTFS